MYAFVTSKCNMACLHCCHSCRPGRGRHMSMEVFEKVVAFSRRHQRGVMLGGGEPTLNPNLLEMIELLDKKGHGNTIWMTHNGTCSTELWLKLLEMPVQMQVSNSIFHSRAIQNPYVMRSAGQRGMLVESSYDMAWVELVGRAPRNIKAIDALAKARRKKVDYHTETDCSTCILPDGQICVWHGRQKFLFGPLSARNYHRAATYKYVE